MLNEHMYQCESQFCVFHGTGERCNKPLPSGARRCRDPFREAAQKSGWRYALIAGSRAVRFTPGRSIIGASTTRAQERRDGSAGLRYASGGERSYYAVADRGFGR